MKPTIVVYSTDPEFFLVFRHILNVAVFESRVFDGEDAAGLETNSLLAMIVDCQPDDAKAIAICEQFKSDDRMRNLPIAALLAPGAKALHVKVLAAGVDETFARPFAPERLLAWLRDRLTGTAVSLETEAGDLVHGDFRLERRTHRLFFRQQEIAMPPIEFRLLRQMIADPGAVFTREDLIAAAWPDHAADAELRSVDVHIARLRKRLKSTVGREVIRTVRSAGYAFAPDW